MDMSGAQGAIKASPVKAGAGPWFLEPNTSPEVSVFALRNLCCNSDDN